MPGKSIRKRSSYRKRRSTKRRSTKRVSTKRRSTKRRSTKRRSTIRRSTKRRSTIRRSTVAYHLTKYYLCLKDLQRDLLIQKFLFNKFKSRRLCLFNLASRSALGNFSNFIQRFRYAALTW
ncbi:hypothetical protein EBZ38_15155 [bacterium]|nr:hypothetical protein [bacterium]